MFAVHILHAKYCIKHTYIHAQKARRTESPGPLSRPVVLLPARYSTSTPVLMNLHFFPQLNHLFLHFSQSSTTHKCNQLYPNSSIFFYLSLCIPKLAVCQTSQPLSNRPPKKPSRFSSYPCFLSHIAKSFRALEPYVKHGIGLK